jgi:DNA polymerase-3 subunit epsilon
MKKLLVIVVNIALIVITNGIWLVFLIPYVVYRANKIDRQKSTKNARDISVAKTKFAGSSFAQDGSKGSVFTYASLNNGKSLNAPFSIIDLETTGLDHSKHRVIEIAIRRIDQNGKYIDEISTLINPKVKDVGPTFLHHIKLEDLKDAPTFEEFAPIVLEKLSDSIAVAHHAAFEDKFLGAEFGRIGFGIPNVPCLDTLWLARQVIDLPNYKLNTVLKAYGIEEEDAHTALGDVRMLSKLLPILLTKSNAIKFLVEPFKSSQKIESNKIKTRVSNLKKGEDGWLSSVMRKLPESGLSLTNEVVESYTEMLNKFLNDGKITGEEAKSLSKFAGSSGLGAQQLKSLHTEYFNNLEEIALSDGILTETEKKKLSQIKAQLGI